jgi:hypothetical protein
MTGAKRSLLSAHPLFEADLYFVSNLPQPRLARRTYQSYLRPLRRTRRRLPFACSRRALCSRLPLLLPYVLPLAQPYSTLITCCLTVLLKDEKAEVDLAGPSLPVLKTLTDRGLARGAASDVLGKVINGMLSACMLNIDEVRQVSILLSLYFPLLTLSFSNSLRKSASAILKTKNNLLATVLLLTSLPANVKVGQEVVEHACFIITETALEGEGDVR